MLNNNNTNTALCEENRQVVRCVRSREMKMRALLLLAQSVLTTTEKLSVLCHAKSQLLSIE
jgi:hypothetical protein